MSSGKMYREKKQLFLSCDYLSCSCDESDTYNHTAPLATALQGCNYDFEWANLFMGQSDASTDKSGEGIWKLLRDQLNDIDEGLLSSIKWLCTDGASAMRSTPLYAGLDSKPDGTSLHAFMKRNLDEDLPNLHGCAHSANLGLKKALDLCQDWTTPWLEHIKAVYNWFSKSPHRKSQLKALHRTMELLQEVVTWRMCYPKYYCPTRWIGLYNALTSILKVLDLLQVYVDKLVTDGYLPLRRPEPEPEEAQNARVDQEEEDDNGEDRFHQSTFHVWDDKSWDLIVTNPTGDVDIATLDERVDMDTGRANAWKDLPNASRAQKKSRLICEKIGLTSMNIGIDSMMCDILKPYKVLTEQLQVQTYPIGHRIRKYINTMFTILNRKFLSESPTYGEHFHKWAHSEDANEDLVNQVKAMGRKFVFHFLDNLRYRFQPYWTTIMALETINPCAPHHISPDAWVGVKDLVRRCMNTNVNPDKVVEQLKCQHEEAQNWCLAEVKACTANLLRYYHDRLRSCREDGRSSKYPLADRFARLVFSLHIASAIIETYFSKTKYIKNLHRSSMRDSLATATLHVQQLQSYMDSDVVQVIGDLDIDKTTALRCTERDLDKLREKYVNKLLHKRFQDEANPNLVRPYKGEVIDVFYSRDDGHYLFHVTYDSDSDDEDLEQWEVSEHIDSYRASI